MLVLSIIPAENSAYDMSCTSEERFEGDDATGNEKLCRGIHIKINEILVLLIHKTFLISRVIYHTLIILSELMERDNNLL